MTQPKYQTIQFVDKGQDFTEWVIRDGIVVDCQPFQFTVWVGGEAIVHSDMAFYKPKHKTNFFPMKHKVLSAVSTDPDYIQGFEDGLNGKDEADQEITTDQYTFGYRAAVYVAGRVK
ncbi:hypothetical protein [Alkalimonas mucilaginosa]|uniref:Uncharacterized protein n=1 Tax=Alkalimonas mucilaginosa TaxID=3057676 RepID=A0ABU7JH82_9GAMM|nr:hypothetical protein [Alkalimonas sp. MEB004]MEE2025054.1 hypothetical protein [Alkalimonas sp. MEB004]